MDLRCLLLFALVPTFPAAAEVGLPTILTDHMVIQRDLPVHVWGTATPGEVVTVAFRGETRSDTAGEYGRWSVYLSPGPAGGPFKLTASGSGISTKDNSASAKNQDPIVLKDVLVGDIWLAGGQSNMEFKLEQASTALADLPDAHCSHCWEFSDCIILSGRKTITGSLCMGKQPSVQPLQSGRASRFPFQFRAVRCSRE
jgi:sialate O-acetylesterase